MEGEVFLELVTICEISAVQDTALDLDNYRPFSDKKKSGKISGNFCVSLILYKMCGFFYRCTVRSGIYTVHSPTNALFIKLGKA
jgi:hypothetical protein